jgi:hypothetical protein
VERTVTQTASLWTSRSQLSFEAPQFSRFISLTHWAVGVRAEAIEALINGNEHDLCPGEIGLVDYARRFNSGRVDDDSYERLRLLFGQRGAVEFNVLLGF